MRSSHLRPAIDASRHHLELASRNGALEMGLELADTVTAGNSPEKMICHQLAITHTYRRLPFGEFKRPFDCVQVVHETTVQSPG